MLRMRILPAGFIEPCFPTKTDKLPAGSQWLHEIKHDGFRIIARKKRVRLRPGKGPHPSLPADVETLGRRAAWVTSRLNDGLDDPQEFVDLTLRGASPQ